MKVYKKKEVIQTVEEKTICDICKEEFDENHSTYWDEVENKEMEGMMSQLWMMKEDNSCYSFHFCAKCFQEKIVPFMKEKFGVDPQKS
jgi:hypothetical protein